MQNQHTKSINKRMVLSLFIVLAAIPALLFASMLAGNRHYYITSLLMIICAMLPMFLLFEQRKPQARELVLLAVMCTIAVLSRTLFIWLPHFKPLVAIVMITGVAFGAEAGFLTGAVSGFVSNFIFGQGPLTPWQMFAFGMAGFLAGLLFQKGLLHKNNRSLCVFGGAAVLLLVGPLLDTGALFMMTSVLTPESAATVYLSGLPVNMLHALATVVTLRLVSRPMFEKLDRIQLKYGMIGEGTREI
ncbi:MAG: ECF transporter S component [Ruthenibacterium sp.]